MNAMTKRPCENLSKNERELSKVMALASGLGLGTVLSISQALTIKGNTFALQFSFKTAIVFLVGFIVTFAFLVRILSCRERASRVFVRSGLVVIGFLGLVACIYPLRFKINQLTGGLGGLSVALGFIGTGLTLIRLVVHAAERQEVEQEANEHPGLKSATKD